LGFEFALYVVDSKGDMPIAVSTAHFSKTGALAQLIHVQPKTISYDGQSETKA
jgi:hypothetical protein